MEQQVQVPVPDLSRANALIVVRWLVAHAADTGKSCSPALSDKWRIGWTTWLAFCNGRGVLQYPIDADAIQSFVVECIVLGKAQTTIYAYLRTLNLILTLAGDPNPFEDEGGKASWRRLERLYLPKNGLAVAAPAEEPRATSAKERRRRDRKRSVSVPTRRHRDKAKTRSKGPKAAPKPEVAREAPPPPVAFEYPGQPSRAPAPDAAAGDRFVYSVPVDYAYEYWTYGRRLKQQALAAWTARRAMRRRVPAIFPLIALAVRELTVDRYTEIGAALLLGAIWGAGGYGKVAAGAGIPRDRLVAAFKRDEVPPERIVQPLAMHLYQIAADGMKV